MILTVETTHDCVGKILNGGMIIDEDKEKEGQQPCKRDVKRRNYWIKNEPTPPPPARSVDPSHNNLGLDLARLAKVHESSDNLSRNQKACLCFAVFHNSTAIHR